MPSRLVGAAAAHHQPHQQPPTTAGGSGIAHLAWVEGACRVRVSGWHATARRRIRRPPGRRRTERAAAVHPPEPDSSVVSDTGDAGFDRGRPVQRWRYRRFRPLMEKPKVPSGWPSSPETRQDTAGAIGSIGGPRRGDLGAGDLRGAEVHLRTVSGLGDDLRPEDGTASANFRVI